MQTVLTTVGITFASAYIVAMLLSFKAGRFQGLLLHVAIGAAVAALVLYVVRSAVWDSSYSLIAVAWVFNLAMAVVSMRMTRRTAARIAARRSY